MLPLSAPASDNARCVTYSHFCRWPSQKPAASPVTVLVSYTLTLNQFLPARTAVESHRIHDGYFWRRFCVFFCFSARAGNRTWTDNLIITSDAHCQLCYASKTLPTGLEPVTLRLTAECSAYWAIGEYTDDSGGIRTLHYRRERAMSLTVRPRSQNVRCRVRTCDILLVRKALSQLS